MSRFGLSACGVLLLATALGCDQDAGRWQSLKPPKEPPRVGSAFERALERGMRKGGDLREEIDALGDYTIRSQDDAHALCAALARMPAEDSGQGYDSRLQVLTGLFHQVGENTDPALNVLIERGQPELIRVFDTLIERNDPQLNPQLLSMLDVLAVYWTQSGTHRVIRAARQPLAPDNYLWASVLRHYDREHPYYRDLVRGLSDPLPPGNLGTAFLSVCNRLADEKALRRHPFDTPAGRRQLQRWLSKENSNSYYALVATEALPHLSLPARNELLDLAAEHPNRNVRLQATFASAKLGRRSGLEGLARMCLDVHTAQQACQYLQDLGRARMIPARAQQMDFRALAEFSAWLQDDGELPRDPDELQVVDHRRLLWPPTGKPTTLWLIKYRLKDTTGLEDDEVACGLVGSVTFCLFGYNLYQRPPEDAYAVHCCWELQGDEKGYEERSPLPSDIPEDLAEQWSGAPLADVHVELQATVGADHGYAGKPLDEPREVYAGRATCEGRPGWIIFDGTYSRWYPQAETPAQATASEMLMVHVGRNLLGFADASDRQDYLVPPRQRPPAEIIAAYEKLQQKLPTADLADGTIHSLMGHQGEYVDALVSERGGTQAERLVQANDRLLQTIDSADQSLQSNLLSGFCNKDRFAAYIDALIERKQTDRGRQLVDRLDSAWNHNLGRRILGAACYKLGDKPRARKYLEQVRADVPYFFEFEEMQILAEILQQAGESDQARDLLIDCLRETAHRFHVTRYPAGRKYQADLYTSHRQAYLRLFPKTGAAELKQRGIAAELL